MRSLDERIAEITRRSDEIIRARKQRRKRILSVCSPSVLCAVLILLAVMGREHSNGNTGIDTDIHYDLPATPVIGEADLLLSAGTVEVTGEGFSRRYSAAEDVRAFIDIFEKVQIGDNSALTAENEESTHGMDGYTITVTDSEGIQTEYILRRELLTNSTTKETFAVPEMELSELMRLLGISNN